MTSTTTTTETPAPQADDNVVMRFLTQGGATVELHRQTRTVNYQYGSPGLLLGDGRTRVSNGFNWRCLGCNAIGGGGRYGFGDNHFDEYAPENSRAEANQHAAACRAMPKPTV
ncbi:hypothetical protein [Streptomyces sp. AD55]|uniref:hypothetical protein n=1 Tax=Streptomyces sp. AD55 TaxID=3242895 RepID=UPI00352824D1